MELDLTIPVTTNISQARLRNNPYIILMCSEGKPIILDAYETKESAIAVNMIVRGVIITNPYYEEDRTTPEEEEEQSPFSYYQN